jgi:AraC family transcriptional activator of pobA
MRPTARAALLLLAAVCPALLLQAQRDLAYTGMTVAEIAQDLGFCEAGYFTRFFGQRLGCTPGQWRVRAALSPPRDGR